MPAQAKVAILLCTFNGARFLQGQLDSYAAQTHANWTVWASDDGSGDGTLAILERQRLAWGPGRLTIVGGPGRDRGRRERQDQEQGKQGTFHGILLSISVE